MKTHNARLDSMGPKGPGHNPDEWAVMLVAAVLLGLMLIAAAAIVRGGGG